MSYSVHPHGLCESKNIGEHTRIWAFSHVLPKAVIGKDCNVCDHVFIENDVIIGDRVTIKSGVQIWDGVTVEDDVFIGPNVSFTNDKFPRSKCYPEVFCKTLIREGASIGANATILPGITIGKKAMVGAGAVVTNDVPPYATVVGNPARIVGYTDTDLELPVSDKIIEKHENKPLNVKSVMISELPLIKDLRGNLTAGEFLKNIPFIPKRYFLVMEVPSGKVRGAHAHKKCHQYLICINGSCAVVVDDGADNRDEILLDCPTKGLYLPPMIWGIQYKYSKDAILLVFASDYYDAADYVRDYDEFQGLINAEK